MWMFFLTRLLNELAGFLLSFTSLDDF
jgi:hypothetical protein